MQMFALPYAGGSASIYRDWISKLEPSMDVCPIEYAGHAGRFSEPFFVSIEEAAEDVSEQIIHQQKKDYIVYGHSMGSFVALETAFILEKKNAVLPKAVIVAACRPPHLRGRGKQLGAMPKKELMEYMVSRGQFDPEILECEELFELLSDIMYADVQMFSKYKQNFESRQIHVPLIALAGQEDDATSLEDMEEWQKYTNHDFRFHMCKGNHFFAFNENKEFMKDLLMWCNPYLERSRSKAGTKEKEDRFIHLCT